MTLRPWLLLLLVGCADSALLPVRISTTVCMDGQLASVSCEHQPKQFNIVCQAPGQQPVFVSHYGKPDKDGKVLEAVFDLFIQLGVGDAPESCS